MAIRYHIALPDPKLARGSDPEFAFRSQATSALFERWRNAQEDPEEVDPALGATDPTATVQGEQHDLHIDLIAVTSIPGGVLRHRLRLLAGSAWELRDVSAT